MATIGHFSVRPRLINILGAQYHSTEEALKELVANAWDADATMVEIELPEPLVPGAIVVRDNGYGMTPRQVQADYLSVAYDRRKQGDRTPKDRKVRGFRGIGKFAGLMAAARMTVKTTARGVQTQFTLDRAIVEQDAEELGQAEIALVEIPNSNGSGTEVRLEGLLQNFAAPSPEKLGRVLLREFARQDDFQITIDGVALSHEMLEGERSDVAFTAPDGNVASGIIWLADKARAIADPGIIVRVNGRAIGPPTSFGLDQEPDIPKSLLARLSGEINADYLADDVIASWSGIIDNSQGYQVLAESVRAQIREQLLRLQGTESGAEQEEFIEQYSEQLLLLPPTRRDRAREALLKVFKRFYDEPLERRRVIAELVLSAFEQDAYWILVQHIDSTPVDEIARLADLLRQWGLVEISELAARTKRRLKALDAFEHLAGDAASLELAGVHTALRNNLWLLGDEYELLSSNRTLRQLVEKVLNKKYRGARARERPDLLLAGLENRYLLVELKRPGHSIDRDDVAQSLKYRDELHEYLPEKNIEVMLVGGRADRGLKDDDYRGVRTATFTEVVLRARSRLSWLIENLPVEDETTDPSDPNAA